jgi:hypothetical protein
VSESEAAMELFRVYEIEENLFKALKGGFLVGRQALDLRDKRF